MSKDGSFLIRRAAVKDAAALRELRLEALQNKPEAFGSDYERESQEDVSHWVERLKDQADQVIFLAVAGTKLVGMTGIGKYRHSKMKHGGYVWGVYVRPAWRGRGMAGRLIKACLRWARGQSLKSVKLAVITTNPAAVTAYIHLGFQVYGVDPKVILCGGVYYDELLMVKEL